MKCSGVSNTLAVFCVAVVVASPAMVVWAELDDSTLENTCGDPPIVQGLCEPSCWCIPDESPCDVCPKAGKRQIKSKTGKADAAFYSSLTIDDGDLFTFKPPGCQPYPNVAASLQVPECRGVARKVPRRGKKVKASKRGFQCSFGGNLCDTKIYTLEQGPRKSPKKSRHPITHTGLCGVCSSAHDLAVNLSSNLGRKAQRCTNAAAVLAEQEKIADTLQELLKCFTKIGFSDDCAFLWASNSLNMLIVMEGAEVPPSCTECAAACLVEPSPAQCYSQQLALGTCELNPCDSCNEELNGPIFMEFGGRTRRNSGIITTYQVDLIDFPITSEVYAGIKRPCSTIVNIQQPAHVCEDS